jgi:hypothetical protein
MAKLDPVLPTRLTGKKGDYTFEMWVEIEGRPLEIYGLTTGDDGVLEAWIASEIGKVSSSTGPIGLSCFLLPDLPSSVTRCMLKSKM